MGERQVLGIYGAGGLGKGISDIVTKHLPQWERVVFVDDVTPDKTVHGLDVLPYDEFKRAYPAGEASLVVAQGEPVDKRALMDKVTADGYELATIVHPSAEISPDVELGAGTVIFTGCYVSAETTIGPCCCLMPNAGIGHNVTMGSCCQISMNTTVGGYASIGNGCYVGLSSSIRDRIEIGDNCIVGQGSAVLQTVPATAVVMGNPAGVISKNRSGRVW